MNHIAEFLKTEYSDHKLIELRDAAIHGELSVLSINNCLLGRSDAGYSYHRRGRFKRVNPAELEFILLVLNSLLCFGKKFRRRLGQAMLPLIDAEINRRSLSAIEAAVEDKLVLVDTER
jgi:hypothetical protein